MFKKISYILGLLFFALLVFVSVKNANLNALVDSIENKTFDLRQNIMVKSNPKAHNDDIVIVAIDDATYEYILDKYGEWPLPRDVYANVINYLEKQSPRIVAFDLMFVKSLKSKNEADEKLVNAFKKYDNVYTSMNFDNQSQDLRTPPVLPDKLSTRVIDNSHSTDFNSLTFTNCRSILKGILDATSNIGIINVSRSDDGILRKMPLFVKYQDNFYPQLALKVGLDYLKQTEDLTQDNFEIDKNSELRIGAKRRVFLDNDGSAILNWYGPAGTYTQIPMYKLIKAANGEKTELNYDFHNKVIYFGTTASSLFDIKTVPTSKLYPGVEVQATYVNNIIDNNFITKVDRIVTIALSLIIAALIAFVVIRVSSAAAATLLSLSVCCIYLIISYYAMCTSNLWLEVVYPLIFAVMAFTCAYIVKYLIKSRDFEQQYKLATTDGLTELYNHRYFQEQMRMQVENAKRYNNSFSLIIIDIDFFKKFNDTFGHQSGDAVLRQVASTLRKNVRATDIVCRYGGEEMSIILPNTGKDEARATAEKICNRVAERKFKLSGDKEANVTISLGVATFPDNGTSASDVIESADRQLYNAKNKGRNQVSVDA